MGQAVMIHTYSCSVKDFVAEMQYPGKIVRPRMSIRKSDDAAELTRLKVLSLIKL